MLIASASIGCDDGQPRALPAPIRPNPDFKMTGKPGRFWGGDNFEFGNHAQLHYIVLRGVSCPPPGAPLYAEALQASQRWVSGKTVTIHVVGHDEAMRERAHVWFENEDGQPLDLGLQLIQHGLANYTGEIFDDAPRYAEAQEIAKQQQIGIWGTQ